MASKWTEEEESLIREHYARKGAKWLRKNHLPHRTLNAIRGRAIKMGIRRIYRNDIRTRGDVTALILNNREGDVIGETLIDTKYLDDVLAYGKWCRANYANGNIYAQCRRAGKGNTGVLHLHRYIMMLDGVDIDGAMIDHANGNGLDNRRENLSIMEVGMNTSRHYEKRSNSIHENLPRGVTIDRGSSTSPYRAQMGYGGRVMNVGQYATPEQASSVYLTMKRMLYWDRRHELDRYPVPPTPITTKMIGYMRKIWLRHGLDEADFDSYLEILDNEGIISLDDAILAEDV